MHILDLHCALWKKLCHPVQVPVLLILSLVVRYVIVYFVIVLDIIVVIIKYSDMDVIQWYVGM